MTDTDGLKTTAAYPEGGVASGLDDDDIFETFRLMDGVVRSKKGGAELNLSKGPRVSHTPAARRTRPPARDKKASEEKLAGLRVLVAEDNATNILLMRGLLCSRVAQVDIVENGAEALKAVQEREYDMVLMDKQMPVMDGVEATKRIRALTTAARKLPIVAVTADAYAGARNEVLAAGMDDFVSKPLTVATLCDAMVRCLGKKSVAVA
ncbi:MAG: response regulator [Pseudomonadota bacterium]